MIMELYQERVIAEKHDLDIKKGALVAFMHEDIYPTLSAVEQGLFMVQLMAMTNYSDALQRRIELF